MWELSLSALLVLKCSRHAGDLAVWVLSVTVPYRQAGTVSTIVLFQTLKRPALAEKRIDLTESTMWSECIHLHSAGPSMCLSDCRRNTWKLIKSADLLTAVYNVSQALVDFNIPVSNVIKAWKQKKWNSFLQLKIICGFYKHPKKFHIRKFSQNSLQFCATDKN